VEYAKPDENQCNDAKNPTEDNNDNDDSGRRAFTTFLGVLIHEVDYELDYQVHNRDYDHSEEASKIAIVSFA